MLIDLSPPQRELAIYMSSLSERAHSAGWMQGLEFSLWRAVSHGPFKYGRLELGPEQVQRLRELSERCCGWIFFHEQQEESFASLSEWAHLVTLEETRK